MAIKNVFQETLFYFMFIVTHGSCVNMMGGYKPVLYTSLTAAVWLFTLFRVQCGALLLTGDFDAQLQYILDQQMYSDNASSLVEDVRNTLNRRWQGLEVVLFGSIIMGLARKSSDIDLSIRLPNFNSSDLPYVLEEAKKLFMKQPEVYSDATIIVPPRYPHIEVFHIPSHREMDVVFTADIAVQISHLLKYYFNLNERNLALTRFLKYWFKIHGLIENATVKLESYGLSLMIIFYLQQKKMAPPAYELQVDSKNNYIDIWDLGFNELPYRSKNTETLHQLVGGFFKYYNEFNFEEYIISPFTGRPIPRNAFEDIDKFPEEYTLYNSTLKHELQHRIKDNLNVKNPVCIQSILQHDINVADKLSPEYATKYKSMFKLVAKLFEDLPSDRILKVILALDHLKETNIIHTQ